MYVCGCGCSLMRVLFVLTVVFGQGVVLMNLINDNLHYPDKVLVVVAME